MKNSTASGDTPVIQVLDRATTLLEAISRYPHPVSLKILSAETSLHASTAHRILASLRQNGFVERDAMGRYQLGMKLLRLSSHLHSNIDVRAIALYIEKATPNRMMHVQQLVGSRAPLHVTAVGKLMLGAGGEQDCRGYTKRTNLPAYTRNTITSLPRLLTEAQEAYARGYAYDNEEAEMDVGCIASLIYDNSGNVACGLSVSAPIERRRDEWVEHVVEAAKTISDKLGYHG